MSDNYVDYLEELDDDDVKGFVEEPDGDYEISNFNNYDPVKLTPDYHIQQGVKAIEQLKFVVDESGWKKTIVKGNSTVYSKNGIEDNDKTPILMSEYTIEGFTPQSIFAVIGMRKLWDPWYEEGSLIENLDDTTSLTYMVMRGMPGTRTRDLCLVEKIECSSEGTIYFASTSVLSDKVPQVVDKVRAHVHLNGWILKPISHNPPRTSVTYVLQIKINGWVPGVMAKKYLLKRPLIINIIDRYLQKNGPPPMIVSSTPVSRPSRSESESNSSITRNGSNSDWTDQQHKVTCKSSVGNLKELRNKSDEEEHNESNSPSPPLPPSSPPSSTPSSAQNSTREISAYSNHEEGNEINSKKSLRQQPLSLRRRNVSKPKRIHNQNPSSPTQEYTPVQNPKQIIPAQSQPTSPVQPASPVEPTRPLPNIKFNAPPPPPSKPTSKSLPIPKPNLIKHRHTDVVNKAVVAFKDSASNLHGWKLYMENKGVKIYMKDVEGRSNPIIRGDYTINGNFMASDFISAARNSSMRKLWDDRFQEGEDLEIFDNNEVMSRVALKGTFPISGRDLALCGTIEEDPKTGRITYVTASVVDPAIPEVKKYVRAHVNFTGWQIDPKFDANGKTRALEIIYIVDINIKLDSVPSSILKTISTSTPMVVQKLEESLQNTGFPPYVFKSSSSKILSENINIANFQYDLSLTAENDDVIEIRSSRTMYPNGFDMAVTPTNVNVESLSSTSEVVRVTLPSKVTTDKLQIKITRRTSQGFNTTFNGNKIKLCQKTNLSVSPVIKDASSESTQPLSPLVEPPKEKENVIQSRSTMEPPKLSQQAEPVIVNTAIVDIAIVDTAIVDTAIVNTTNIVNSTDTTLKVDVTDTDKDNRNVSRKSKRLSFANSPPSIINPEVEKEPQIFEAEIVPLNKNKEFKYEITPNTEYEEYEKAMEEIKQIEEIEGIPPDPIEYRNVYNVSRDIVVITDSVRFNSHQAAVMFVSMMLAYYAGKLSYY